MSKQLIVFDVCDTLYQSNTTFDFIRFVLKEKKLSFKARLFRIFTFKYSPFFILFYLLQKITKQDICKQQCLALLKGFEQKELLELAKKFKQEDLEQKKITATHKMLQEFKQKKLPIVLLSASIDPVIQVIAEDLGLPFLSSQISYSNQSFDGKLRFEMTGQKQTKLEEFGFDSTTELTVVTDNFSDKGLMTLAKNRYAVVYSEQAKTFWAPLSPNYIDLTK